RELCDLLEGDLPFRPERDGVGYARRAPTAAILGPRLRQVEPVGDRHARALVSHRDAHRHLTVVLFAEHAAVLPGDADGVTALLGPSGIVDDPRRDPPPPGHSH